MIEIKNIIKRYGSNLAVDNISLTIKRGEIFGLLGPNEAGKSTTIKMIMGLLKADSGEIIIDNMVVNKNNMHIKRKLGFVPQNLAIYENMTAKENVEFFGQLYGIRGKQLKNNAAEALEFTGLIDRQKEKPKKFSGGMKRRLNIACALVHNPEIIIMDEPTVGIDPQSRNHILESVKLLNKRGATIIYTSHYMEEVEGICNRTGIIDHGKLISLGTIKDLKDSVNQEQKIIIQVHNLTEEIKNELEEIKGVNGVILTKDNIEILSSNAQMVLQDILFTLYKNDIKVNNIMLQEPDLESVFLALTGRSLRD